jgi:Protein of unknown function (DUF2905)
MPKRQRRLLQFRCGPSRHTFCCVKHKQPHIPVVFLRTRVYVANTDHPRIVDGGGRPSLAMAGGIGLGRLPGDFTVKRDGLTLYAPIATCLIISIVVSLVLWLLRR